MRDHRGERRHGRGVTMDGRRKPDGVDPERNGAAFLAWLKKRGGLKPVDYCKSRCSITGFNPSRFVKSLDSSHIQIYTFRGEKVIKLEDWDWADRWMVYYGQEVPHHRHRQSL